MRRAVVVAAAHRGAAGDQQAREGARGPPTGAVRGWTAVPCDWQGQGQTKPSETDRRKGQVAAASRPCGRWPMVTPGGGKALSSATRLCGASGTRYAWMRGLT
eukprot:5991304-Prymnesium_polylepis.1